MPTDIESSQLPSNVRVITINRYYPSGVSQIIARSACRFIGIVDESTVMKYTKIEGDRQCREWLEIKAKIYEAVGSHPHILGFKGLNDHGILLQRAHNVTCKSILPQALLFLLAACLHRCSFWSRQSRTSTRHVIHCDIALRNFLLDENLDLLLADFQGTLKSDYEE